VLKIAFSLSKVFVYGLDGLGSVPGRGVSTCLFTSIMGTGKQGSHISASTEFLEKSKLKKRWKHIKS
jgi:hypothetical protein